VDAHFGWAKNLAVYEISPQGYNLIEAIQFPATAGERQRGQARPKLEAIKDCAILYVAAIGGSAAARVVAHKIHPIKVNEPEAINEILNKLQEVLKGEPPPWLRKQ